MKLPRYFERRRYQVVRPSPSAAAMTRLLERLAAAKRPLMMLGGGGWTAEACDDIRAFAAEQARRFRDDAPTTAGEAATIILEGVKADAWRILVGGDAHRLDALVRASPEEAYEPDFFQRFAKEVGWRLGT